MIEHVSKQCYFKRCNVEESALYLAKGLMNENYENKDTILQKFVSSIGDEIEERMSNIQISKEDYSK